LSEPVRITTFGHACVRLEVGGRVLVVDPGTFSDAAAVDGADAVLVTHSHYDHLSADHLARARAANPAVELWGSAESAAAAGEALGVRVLEAGSTVSVAGVEVRVLGGRHAEIEPGTSSGDNVALLIAGVYHPGDSLTLPGESVDTLLVPIQAPWSRVSEVVAFVRAVAPGQAVPIHDALLSDVGIAAFDRNISTRVPDVPYRRLAAGESLDPA
jgi:L-ascorbate metabolism protein UlaG (beta-lactamase superfamily)